MRQDLAYNSKIPLSTIYPDERIAGCFLLLVGLGIAVFPWLAENRDEVGPIILNLLSVLGCLMVYGGFMLSVSAKRLDVSYDRVNCAIVIKQTRWFSRKVEVETFNSSQIKGFELEAKRDFDGDDWVHINLKLNNGRKIAVTKAILGRENALEEREKFEVILQTGTLEREAGVKKVNRLNDEDKALRRRAWQIVCAVCAFVIAVPFVAMYLGERTAFEQIHVMTGFPDAATTEAVKAMVGSVMHEGEKILWVGQPEVGREGSLKMGFFMPFAVIWTLFSLVWEACALAALKQTKSIVGVVLSLFGLPFVFIGFGMLSTPYFARGHELSTVYILTNECAIRVMNNKPCRLVEYDEADFGPIEVTRYKSNRADVMFVKDASEGQRRPYGGFYGVEDADRAAEILRSQSQH